LPRRVESLRGVLFQCGDDAPYQIRRLIPVSDQKSAFRRTMAETRGGN
jgi:hypothetical protein